MKKKNTSVSFGVIGLGRFGSALVECLAKSEKEVIAIDKDEAKVKEARSYTVYAMVVEALDREYLEEAGMQNCDTVVICIGEQMDISILTTMTVLKMNVPHVIAKANSIIHGEVLKQLGARVIYPERDMAVRLGKGLIYNSFLDSVALEGDVEVRRIQVTDRLIGVTIQQADTRRKYKLNIIAIEHNHHTDVDFPSEYCFQEGDVICVVGQTGNIEKFEDAIQ
ncbi:MAG: TrkA family potassium uptake protein [Clostridiales bacterium]|nr:TrkA family potassium uptake protein [Clostridiales bacterium]